MRLRRLKVGIDPIYVAPYLKSGTIANVIKILDRQPVSIAVGECKTICWQFTKPDDLDLNQFYEYTDFEDANGNLNDFIWRTDRIVGFVGNSSGGAAKQVETLTWPLFNEGTKRMPAPIQVVSAIDLSGTLPGWQVVAINPDPSSPITLYPRETPVGTITIQKPVDSDEGVSVIRPRLINVATGDIVQEVNLRFKVDYTPPDVREASAQRQGDFCLFRVIAADTGSGVADSVQLHISVNEAPVESIFLESFEFSPTGGALTSPCLTFVAPTTFTAKLGPFKPADRIQYFFTILDNAGNTVQTAPATIPLGH
jgi:hypothetical protein